jgi:hypothetical protein
MGRMARTQRSQRAFRWLVVGALIGVIGGCGGTPEFILDSDIPTPTALDSVLVNQLKRDDGLLVGASAIYVGKIANAEATLADLEQQFADSGWTLETASGDDVQAVGVFTKDARSCRVRVLKNELNPAMSRMNYTLGDRDG